MKKIQIIQTPMNLWVPESAVIGIFPFAFQWYFYCSSATSPPFVSREKSLLLTFLKGFTNEGKIKDRLERGKSVIWSQLRPLRETGYGPFQVHPVVEAYSSPCALLPWAIWPIMPLLWEVTASCLGVAWPISKILQNAKLFGCTRFRKILQLSNG